MPRYARVEIPKKVKLEVFERAGGPGNVCCEGTCKLPLRGKKFEYHHDKAEWLQNEPPASRPPITAADVRLLCLPCHHAVSAKDTKVRAHGKRIVEKIANIDRRSASSGRRGFSDRYKKKMSGDIIDTVTGEIIRKGRP
jgi:hypothetical protein